MEDDYILQKLGNIICVKIFFYKLYNMSMTWWIVRFFTCVQNRGGCWFNDGWPIEWHDFLCWSI